MSVRRLRSVIRAFARPIVVPDKQLVVVRVSIPATIPPIVGDVVRLVVQDNRVSTANVWWFVNPEKPIVLGFVAI